MSRGEGLLPLLASFSVEGKFFCLVLYLSVCLFVCRSVCLFICLFVCLNVWGLLSLLASVTVEGNWISLFVCLLICLLACLYAYPRHQSLWRVRFFVCLVLRLSVRIQTVMYRREGLCIFVISVRRSFGKNIDKEGTTQEGRQRPGMILHAETAIVRSLF